MNLKNVSIGIKPEILRPRQDDEYFVSNKVNPRVSIISPSLNLGQFVEDTILSVARQNFKDFEHIIIDGGSTDGTKEIVSKYPHVTFYSEPDSGPCDAINKGLKIAKGDYVILSCISDGLLNENWLEICVKQLDSDPEISLVWGLPQYLSEDGILGRVAYINDQFSNTYPPQKYDWFNYWAATKFWFPDGNVCVRKKIYDECWPKDDLNKTIEPTLEFNYLFNSNGYLPFFVDVIANFGREHKNQMGQEFSKAGMMTHMVNDYKAKSNSYLLQNSHYFKDGNSNIIKYN